MSKRSAFKASLARAGSPMTTPYEQTLARKYDPSEPRDEMGRWSGEGAGDDSTHHGGDVAGFGGPKGYTGSWHYGNVEVYHEDRPGSGSGHLVGTISATGPRDFHATSDTPGTVVSRSFDTKEQARNWLTGTHDVYHAAMGGSDIDKFEFRESLARAASPMTSAYEQAVVGKYSPDEERDQAGRWSWGDPGMTGSRTGPSLRGGTGILNRADGSGISLRIAGDNYTIPYSHAGYVGRAK